MSGGPTAPAPPARRGWKLVAGSALVGILVLGVAAVALKDTARERWHIWGLEHGDPAGRAEAANALVEMGSLAAIGPLLEQVRRAGPLTIDPHLAPFDKTQAFLSAIGSVYRIALKRRAATIPRLTRVLDAEKEPFLRDLIQRLVWVARGESDQLEISSQEDSTPILTLTTESMLENVFK